LMMMMTVMVMVELVKHVLQMAPFEKRQTSATVRGWDFN